MSLGDIGLATSRWNARNKSIALMILYPVIVIFTGYYQFLVLYILCHYKEMSKLANPHYIERVDTIYPYIIPFIVIFFVIWLVICLRNQDEIVRRLFHANWIDRKDNPDLFSAVETLAIQLGRSIPEIYLIDTWARNSFACTLADGTDRIYVTSGLLENLGKDEVEAVLAHEFAHIINEDTRWIALSIIFTNLLGSLPAALTDHSHFENLDQEKAQSAASLLVLNLLFLPLWLGFLGVSLTRLFIMFEREHQADLLAVEITKNADAMMRALIRVHKRARIPHIPINAMFLCIDNPRGGFFATHPRLFSRLSKIASMTNTQIPTITESSSAPIHKRFSKNKLLERTFRPFKPRM
ncbi:MAG TPA: M48 family metalloprotease [Alphaproteobacteria bacterium]|nr:M48 family metalloprotease [Alphaproteobacteria bacterium]